MKGLDFLLTFLGGAAVGALVALLLAPEKGEDTRARIAQFLKDKGVSLRKDEIDELIEQIEGNNPR